MRERIRFRICDFRLPIKDPNQKSTINNQKLFMTLEFETYLTESSETLTPQEAKSIEPFFTNTDRSVVALVNLPEVVRGALFSRYSRSAKGVRRLFLDEFFGQNELEAFANLRSLSR